MSKARDIVETLRTVLVDGDVTNANFTGADLEIGKGGTGASSAGAARTALGVAIGSDVLAPDGSAANLTNLPAGGAEDFVASGTLPNGSPVILNSNGTVTVVGGEGVTAIPAGSEYVFSTASTQYLSVAFDPNNANKFVAAYLNGGTATGRAIVGTVSGTSISFGTEVVFHSADIASTRVLFDPNTSGKFVICYRQAALDDSGTAIVGTISGTSLSFGSPVVFDTRVSYLTGAFDPNTAGKFVVTYRDRLHSTQYSGTACIGTVSGTSISFGSLAVFNLGQSNNLSTAFDPNTAGKFIITYADVGNSSYGTAIIGTVSGTSISYGSEAVFSSTSSSNLAVAFDPSTANELVIVYQDSSSVGKATIGTVSGTSSSFGTAVTFNSGSIAFAQLSFDPNTAGEFVVAYADVGNSSYGTAKIGSISGTSISFSSKYVFNAADTQEIGLSFDPNSSKMFTLAYMDSGNSSYGTSIVGTVSTTNLTSTNFLGTATAAYTNGQTASIMLKGGISDNQTSLTAGSTYYVQPTGTFATSAGTPSVLAGEAVSATSLLLNGLATPAAPDEIPSQTGNTGKFLTTDGTDASWDAVIPSQTSQSGKFLTTNGSAASWAIVALPATLLFDKSLF